MPETWDLTEKGHFIFKRENSVFDFIELYNAIQKWAKDNNYEFCEKGFEERIKSTGKHYFITFEIKRSHTEFAHHNMEIEIIIKDMIDVISADNKVHKNKGNIELVIKSVMTMDPKDRFESNGLFKALRKFYINYIGKPKLLALAGDMAGFHNLLIDLIKKHFDFYNP